MTSDLCRLCKSTPHPGCDDAVIYEREDGLWTAKHACPLIVARKRRHGGAYPADWLIGEFPQPPAYADADITAEATGRWAFQEPARLALLDAIAEQRNVIIHGKANRSGKTRLAFGAVRHFRETLCESALLINAPDLMRVIAASFKPDFDRWSEDDLLDALGAETRLLVLDDLGQGKVSDYADGVFYSLANSRLNHGLPTIVTTNFTRKELVEKYGPATISRLLQEAVTIKLEDPESKWGAHGGNPNQNTERSMNHA